MNHRSLLLPTVVGTVLLFAACSGGGSATASTSLSSMLTLATSSAANATDIPVGGGTVSLDAAVFHVDRVHITQEIAAGVDPGPGASEPGSGGTDGRGHRHRIVRGEPGTRGNPGRPHRDEIEVLGPFTFDITSGTTVLDSVSVYPGTFTGSELFFSLEAADPFVDHSIVFTGSFQPTAGGEPIPLTLRSAWLKRMTVPIANGGVVVSENSVIPIEIAFDLPAMLVALDLSTATVESGEIVIDEAHNTALLDAFENGLGHRGGCVEFREHVRR